jgi:hypothetical protein
MVLVNQILKHLLRQTSTLPSQATYKPVRLLDSNTVPTLANNIRLEAFTDTAYTTDYDPSVA